MYSYTSLFDICLELKTKLTELDSCIPESFISEQIIKVTDGRFWVFLFSFMLARIRNIERLGILVYRDCSYYLFRLQG